MGSALDQCLGRLSESSSRETIHECRVAARKLRAASRALRRPPIRLPTRPLSQDLKALLQDLAPARDADVRLETLRNVLLQSASMNSAKSRELLALAYVQHARLRSELANLTKSPRWARRRARLGQRAMEAASLLQVRESPLQSLKELIQRTDLGLRGRMRRVPRSPEKIHRLRMKIKELRYLLEAFGQLCGELECVGVKPLGRLQDRIGEFHDLWSLGNWLESAPPPEDRQPWFVALRAFNPKPSAGQDYCNLPRELRRRRNGRVSTQVGAGHAGGRMRHDSQSPRVDVLSANSTFTVSSVVDPFQCPIDRLQLLQCGIPQRLQGGEVLHFHGLLLRIRGNRLLRVQQLRLIVHFTLSQFAPALHQRGAGLVQQVRIRDIYVHGCIASHTWFDVTKGEPPDYSVFCN